MAEKRPTDGYGERIARALRWGPKPLGSVRRLAREVSAVPRYRSLRGATYGGIRQYVSGNVRRPRVELLRALADVLRVREDWLILDDGEMTEDDERHRLLLEQLAESQAEDAAEFHSSVLRAMRAPVDYEPTYWFPALLEASHRLGVDAKTLAAALRGPLRALAIDPGRMTNNDFSDYMLAMAPVLLGLADERHAQAPYINKEEDDGQ